MPITIHIQVREKVPHIHNIPVHAVRQCFVNCKCINALTIFLPVLTNRLHSLVSLTS